METPSTISYLQNLVSPRFPTELILKIVQNLQFGNGKAIADLRSTHPRIKEILNNYEHSVTRCFIETEARHAQVDFPCDKCFTYNWLANSMRKYDVVDDIMDAFASNHNCFAVEMHNLALCNAGLLLLYRLQTLEDYRSKHAYIQSLQKDPLTAIYLTLHHATLSARYHGSGWMSQRKYGRFMDANQLSLRNELEFCFAEATLHTGPDFISDTLLRQSSDAEIILMNCYHDHGTHDWEWPCWGGGKGEFEPPRTQGPHREPESNKSLFTALIERLAELTKYPVEDVRAKLELDLQDTRHPLAWLDLTGKARLLQGLDLDVKLNSETSG